MGEQKTKGDRKEEDHSTSIFVTLNDPQLQKNDNQKNKKEDGVGNNSSTGSSNIPVCIVSRYDTISCGLCQETIGIGEEMFAFTTTTTTTTTTTNNNNKKEEEDDKIKKVHLCWGHKDCYSFELVGPPPVCRHWMRLGCCPSLEVGMCAFRHDEVDRGGESSNNNDSNIIEKRKWGGKRRLVRNGHKNTVFRIFLMQTYTLEYLASSGFIVLDVGGGKGELSWELLNLMGVQSVVVDPRPLSLHNKWKQWINGLYEPKRIGPVFSKWYPRIYDGCQHDTPKRPPHIRCFFDATKFLQLSSLTITTTDQSQQQQQQQQQPQIHQWFQSELSHARRVTWTTRGLQHHEDENNNNNNRDNEEQEEEEEDNNTTAAIRGVEEEEGCCLGEEVVDSMIANQLLQKCGLVIGLHPDQAAGDIAAYATAQKLPWCIVPCCVYSDMFTTRRLKNNNGGGVVKSHSQLIQWLCETYPEAKVATLDNLEGKNQVVYTLPTTTTINP